MPFDIHPKRPSNFLWTVARATRAVSGSAWECKADKSPPGASGRAIALVSSVHSPPSLLLRVALEESIALNPSAEVAAACVSIRGDPVIDRKRYLLRVLERPAAGAS